MWQRCIWRSTGSRRSPQAGLRLLANNSACYKTSGSDECCAAEHFSSERADAGSEFSTEPGGDSRAAWRRGAAVPELSALADAEFAACAGRCGDAFCSRAAAEPAEAEVGLDRHRFAERSRATYGDHRERCNGERDGRTRRFRFLAGRAACRRGRSRSSPWISTTTSETDLVLAGRAACVSCGRILLRSSPTSLRRRSCRGPLWMAKPQERGLGY